ncbi:MAG TPA: DUF1634 domain-containing protein [Planctomycetaceae bacterium]|nr:DUF1634 domain-containing protein [Planctomycetaceae bacterium]
MHDAKTDGPARAGFDDQRMEVVIGNLLRAGVMLAGAVVLIGAIVYLIAHGSERPPHFETFKGEPTELESIPGIFHFALSLHGRGIIQLGVLLLVATPIFRVLVSVFAFLRERDYLYTVITLIVLGLLLYSLFS